MVDDRRQSGSKQSDLAALAASATAVAVALFVVPGPYDPLSLMISVTLSVLIVAYLWNHPRARHESVGVAAVIALITLPAFGFFIELCKAEDPVWLILQGESLNCGTKTGGGRTVRWSGGEPCNADDRHSRVPVIALFIVWLLIWAAAFAAEWKVQRGWRHTRPEASRTIDPPGARTAAPPGHVATWALIWLLAAAMEKARRRRRARDHGG